MPIYEYLCESCGRVTEVMQKVSDRAPAACPECGSKRLAKLVSRTAFQLKGGGWYADLYGSPKKKEGGKEPGKEGGKGPEGAKEAGSEGASKPAAPQASQGKAPGKAAPKKPSAKGG